ncbi:Chromatin structure-remodeling complex subunit rsc7 [Spathaspora sp. JA1]|nr:Chromatin structure-remodeling complex subunit rsc7 [Spathaspora sp. JA1]
MAKRRGGAIKQETEDEVKNEDDVKIEEGDDINNDEYVEDEEVASDDEDIEEDNDEDNSIIRRRSRKRTSGGVDDEDDVDGEENQEGDDNEEEEEEENEGDDTGIKQEGDEDEEVQTGPKKRGRKRTKFTVLEEGVFDSDGNPISIVDDEVVINHEDPKGKEKIDEFGNLQGGREFRMKTFTLLGKGDKLYMISTEPARLVGFRDSYLLFKTHRTLFKKVCTHDEKMDLINRGLIPNSYKGRSVNLVAARSIFREFGARMIKQGKKVIDDFWEQRSIDAGDISGDYADPNELFPNQSKLSTIFGDGVSIGSGGGGGGATPLTATPIVNYQSDPSWMYQIAQQTQEYNRKLMEHRSQIMSKGSRDIYTNLTFYPESSQPTKWKLSKYVGDTTNLTYDVTMIGSTKPITGLSKISKELMGDIEDEEIKQAIIAQQRYEATL